MLVVHQEAVAFDRAIIAPDQISFVLCIEGNGIEPQALLLCESIRRFGGRYRGSPIIAVTPRPDLPIAAVKTMDQLIDESLQGNRVESGLLLSFAGAALLLAAIGIYGVLAFSVVQRTGEIGTRLALGAQESQVVRLILREGLALALTGLVLGLLGTLFLKRVMATLLFGIGVVDPAAIGAVSALLVAVALLACYLPARRAARVDPLVALRES